MPAEPSAVVVVAAVVERDGRYLVTRRPPATHLAGLWEFPGGKCDPDEPHDACLVRELREELGVGATVDAELLVTEHAYPDRVVRLHFRRCEIDGTPVGLQGQEVRWVARADLRRLDFPEADRDLIALLAGGNDEPPTADR